MATLQKLTDPLVVFQIELVCQQLKSTEVASLSLPSFPTSFHEVKEAIEKSFKAPSYLQTLWVHGEKIDNQSVGMAPSQFYLRAGDTIKVSFPMKCDCEKVKDITKWLSECLDIIQTLKASLSEDEVKDLYSKNMRIRLNPYFAQSLMEKLFYPMGDESKLANAWYFDYLGGIKSLVKIHREVRNMDLCGELLLLQSIVIFFESICCILFTDVTVDSALCQRAIECGVLECGLNTFLSDRAVYMHSCYLIDIPLSVICK